MTDKLKQLIEKAEFQATGIYTEFLIIPTEQPYEGFWGVNGFNNCIVLGRNSQNEQDNWHRISRQQCDVFNIINNKRWCNIDVPSELGCVHLFFDEKFEVNYPTSSVMAYAKEINT